MIRNANEEVGGRTTARGNKRQTQQASEYKGPRTEAEFLKKLHLNKKEFLTKTDHQKIAEAVRPLVRPLRQTEPKLAAHLYYISWRHKNMANAPEPKKSNRRQNRELAAAA